MKSNKRIVANANVMIAFFIHLHIVIISDVKNVRKITNSRKISVLLNRLGNIEIIVPEEIINDCGKGYIYFKD